VRRRYEARCSKCGITYSSDNEGRMYCRHGTWLTAGYSQSGITTSPGRLATYSIPAWTPPSYEYAPENWIAL
jgi:hypothetical protein